MEDSIYDSPWTGTTFDQNFWQQMLNWINNYFQQNVGVTLDGPLTQSEQSQLEAWFSNPDNVFDYAQAFYSQTFFQDFVETLPDYDYDENWNPSDDDYSDLSDFFALFSGEGGMQWPGLDADLTGLFDGLLDDEGLLDDDPAGPPFQPVVDEPVVEDMALLYQAALERKPDGPGLNYWVGNLREGQSLQDIARSFYQADEFRSQFDEFDDESYINQLYENVLGRQADQAGIDYWLNDIQNNGRSHAEVLVSFAQSEENRDNAEAWLAGLQFDTSSDDWIL